MEQFKCRLKKVKKQSKIKVQKSKCFWVALNMNKEVPRVLTSFQFSLKVLGPCKFCTDRVPDLCVVTHRPCTKSCTVMHGPCTPQVNYSTLTDFLVFLCVSFYRVYLRSYPSTFVVGLVTWYRIQFLTS